MSGQKYIEMEKRKCRLLCLSGDYVLGLEQIKSTSAYEKDKKYWEDRVETFADAPDLPLAKNESQITEQRFCRRSAKLSQKEWQSVKDAAGRLEVTPSVLLMSAYAETSVCGAVIRILHLI